MSRETPIRIRRVDKAAARRSTTATASDQRPRRRGASIGDACLQIVDRDACRTHGASQRDRGA